MFSKMTRTILYAVLGSCLFASAAQAQDVEDFKNRMSKAAAMTKVDMGEALRQYLEIRIQYAGPEVDYSLGRAYQRMNQCEQAQHYYTQVMVAYDLPEDHPIYKRAVDAFDEIASCKTWQKVTIDCEMPAGGYAILDGERVTACWDRAYSLKDGEHVFTIVDAAGKKIDKKFSAKSGSKDENIRLALPAEKIEVEKVVNVENSYILKEKFHPGLYWGLIVGGAVVTAVGGFMTGFAGSAKADEQKYADLYALAKDDTERAAYDKKRKDANDRVKTGNIVMYSLVGVGSAAILSGIIIGIVSAASDKERVKVDDNDVNAYFAPLDGGMSMGFGMRF